MWTTYRDHFGLGQFLIVRCNGNFCGAVAVEDAGLRGISHLGKQLVGEFLSTGTTNTDVGNGMAKIIAREPRLPARRSAGDHRDMLLLDKMSQIQWIVGLLFGCQDECLTVVESRSYILQGSIKGNGRNTEYAFGICMYGIGKDIGGMAIEIIADAFVAKHYALGTTCGAAGVNEIGKVVGSDLR